MKKHIIFLILILLILSTCTNEPLNPLGEDIKSAINNAEDKDTDNTENQASGHIIARYLYENFFIVNCNRIYEKINDKYTLTVVSTIGLNPEPTQTNQIDISEEKFNNAIYIFSFLEGRSNYYEEVSEEELNSLQNSDPEIHGCVIHISGGHRINYNANGIIIYDYYYQIGSYDVWYIRQLISYSNK